MQTVRHSSVRRLAALAIVAAFAALASALVVWRRVLAQAGDPIVPTDLMSLLMWLTTAGGASAVVSFIAEKLAVWQLPPESGGLSSQAKWWIMLAASAALSIGAKLLIDFLPATAIDALTPYATIVIGIFVAFLANQAAYGLQKAAQKDRSPLSRG